MRKDYKHLVKKVLENGKQTANIKQQALKKEPIGKKPIILHGESLHDIVIFLAKKGLQKELRNFRTFLAKSNYDVVDLKTKQDDVEKDFRKYLNNLNENIDIDPDKNFEEYMKKFSKLGKPAPKEDKEADRAMKIAELGDRITEPESKKYMRDVLQKYNLKSNVNNIRKFEKYCRYVIKTNKKGRKFEELKYTDFLGFVKNYKKAIREGRLQENIEMNNFREWYEEKEVDNLNESAAVNVALAALAIPSLGVLVAWGGTNLVKSYSNFMGKAINKITNNARAIKNNFKLKKDDVKQSVIDLKKDPKVVAQLKKIELAKEKFSKELYNVYEEIDKKNFDEAGKLFNELDKNVNNNPEVRMIIIERIVGNMCEEPLYIQSPGNKTYRAIKSVINIKVARAAAYATKKAYEQLDVDYDEDSREEKNEKSLSKDINKEG